MLWLSLLYPRWRSISRHWLKGASLKTILLVCIALGLWSGIFFVFYRVLAYFQSIESLGDFLAAKVFSMILAVFLFVLLFSNIICALSAFYLSQDLHLILSLPVLTGHIYAAKLTETTINSSWMVLLFGSPVFLAYGTVYHASWLYYLYCFLVLVPFLLISSTTSTMLVMALVNIFPARRTRDILLILSILFIVVLYLLIRFLQPEALVDPENFAHMIDYLTSLRSFSLPIMPTYWVNEALLPLIQPFYTGGSSTLFYVLMLWSTSLALLVIGEWMSSRMYLNGWSKSQEGRKVRFSQGSAFNKGLDALMRPFSPAMRMIVEKDIKTFFRDATQWSQLLLILSLIVVYLYNFTVLPLDSAPIPTIYLQNLLSFLNLGLAGFVLSAIAVRFVYPSVSMEGQAFWIVRTSPLSLKSFIWSKFCLNLLPLLVLAHILIVCSNLLLRATHVMMFFSLLTILLLSFGITSLGIGMGALYPRFRYTNVADIPSGFGGLLFMVLSLGLIGATVLLEARPVYLLFSSSLGRVELSTWAYLEIALAFFMILILNISAIWLPVRCGLKNLMSRERFE